MMMRLETPAEVGNRMTFSPWKYVRLIVPERRRCETIAVYVALMYEGADQEWVNALVSRAYQVASKGRGPSDVLEELAERVLTPGAEPPFGTAEEMIPG